MVTSDHYDLIVIGSGPGGGSLAQRLAPTGKRILMLERGGYLPRSRENWDAKTVFVDGKYQSPDTWYGKKGEAFHPALHYYVGGNSKVYGAALFRLRERDFGALQHVDGFRRLGRSATTFSNRITARPKRYSTCMGNAEKIRPNLGPASLMPFRRSSTSPESRP